MNVSSEAFIYDWFFTVFTRAVDYKVVRVVWDVIFCFGDFYFLGIGLSLFISLSEELINSRIEDGFNFLREKTRKIPASKIIKNAFKFKISHEKFYEILSENIIENSDKN